MNDSESNLNFENVRESLDKQMLNSFIGKEGFFWTGSINSLKTFTALHVEVKSILVEDKKVTFSFTPLPTKGFFGPSPFYDFSEPIQDLSIWEYGIKFKPGEFLFSILIMRPDWVKKIIDRTDLLTKTETDNDNNGEYFSGVAAQILDKTKVFDVIENPLNYFEVKRDKPKSIMAKLFEKLKFRSK